MDLMGKRLVQVPYCEVYWDSWKRVHGKSKGSCLGVHKRDAKER
jgi:hypothetical protein